MSPTLTSLIHVGAPVTGFALRVSAHVTPLTVIEPVPTEATFPEIRITRPECGCSSVAAESTSWPLARRQAISPWPRIVVGAMIRGFGEPLVVNVHVTPRTVMELSVALTAPRTTTAPAGRSTTLATTSRPLARTHASCAVSPTPMSRMIAGIIIREFVGANAQVVPATLMETGDTACTGPVTVTFFGTAPTATLVVTSAAAATANQLSRRIPLPPNRVI